MMSETRWKVKGLEVQVPSAHFLEGFTETMRSRSGVSGDIDSVIKGLFGVHFYIENGTALAAKGNPLTIPGRTSYSVNIDEAEELAKWLIERLQDIRERSGLKRNSEEESEETRQ